jgi:hypothetical protein
MEGKWEAAGRQHGCYCGVWDKNPALYEKLGYPLGFCGICERCGVPGHTRHFPGPIPYTGSWCDRCYRILAWTWPNRPGVDRAVQPGFGRAGRRAHAAILVEIRVAVSPP